MPHYNLKVNARAIRHYTKMMLIEAQSLDDALIEVRGTVEEHSPDETWTSTTDVYFDEIDRDQIEVVGTVDDESGPTA